MSKEALKEALSENRELKKKNEELTEDLNKIVEESLALGEGLRGRPFLPEDLDCFTITAVDNKYGTHVEKEIFSLDGYHISRGHNNIWFVITPAEITVPVEINDMFEGIMVLRALGLKRITFHGFIEADDLVEEMMKDFDEVLEIRNARIARENEENITE